MYVPPPPSFYPTLSQMPPRPILPPPSWCCQRCHDVGMGVALSPVDVFPIPITPVADSPPYEQVKLSVNGRKRQIGQKGTYPLSFPHSSTGAVPIMATL
jgi:hypothetical protein